MSGLLRAVPGPHRRYNPLMREWVLVSPQRLARPWLGRTEPAAAHARPPYDPECYLCPGNARAGHARNPQYEGTFVFDNDFPALSPDPHEETRLKPRATSVNARLKPRATDEGLLVSEPEHGICRVICFSPRHDKSLPSLTTEELRRVVDVWVDQFIELGARPWISHVQIFENRGAAMGASNPHPHGQIWANATVPGVPEREQAALAAHRAARGSCLLCDYLALEQAGRDRIVCANGAFTAVVPFWAVWPFEVLLLANRHVTGLDGLDDGERTCLADILQRATAQYDRLFDAPCPYSMGFHQRPTDGRAHDEWHLHAHFYPPVLRSASVHKFMVGYELLATSQRDVTAEAAAARLRELADGT